MKAPARDIDLLVITDRQKTRGRPLAEVVERAQEGGARWFQLREKDLPSGRLLELAWEIRAVTASGGSRLIVNDRADVALAVGADGLHLPANGLPPEVARRLLGGEMLIGVSTHSAEEALRAAEGGADYITFGPIFYTPSKASYGPPVGLERLREVVALDLSLPVLGLGGVKPGNVGEVVSGGASGVALISAVISAEDPAEAARGILLELKEASKGAGASKP